MGLASIIKAAMSILTILMFYFLSKIMSASQYGYFGFGFSLIQVLAIVATGGLHLIVFRWFPETRSSHGAEDAQAVLRQGLLIVIVFSILTATVTSVALMEIYEGRRINHAIGLSATVFLFSITEYLSSALRAQGRIGVALAPRDIFWRGGLMVIFMAMSFFGLNMQVAPIFWIMSSTLLAVAAYQVFVLMQEKASSTAPKRNFAALVSQVWPIWLSGLITSTARNRDVIILGVFIEPAALAGYFLATRVANALSLATAAANSVSANVISEAYYESQHGRLQSSISNITSITFALTSLGSLVLILFSGLILSSFGSEYADSRIILIILVLTTLGATCLGPVHYILDLTGHQNINLKIISVSAIVTTLAQVVLIILFGALGAALGTAGVVLVPRVWAYTIVRQRHGFDPSIVPILLKVTAARMK